MWSSFEQYFGRAAHRFWLSFQPKPFALLIVSMAIALSLSGCGKSTDDRKYEVVKCATYFDALGMAAISGGNGGSDASFLQALNQSQVQTAGLQQTAAGISSLGQQLSQTIDPAKSAAAQQEGTNLFTTEEQNNDVSGATGFINECVDNYNKLIASQQQ